MSDPQIAAAISATIQHFATACAEMKKQASGLSDGIHKAGVMQGIEICADAIKKLQADVDDAARQIGSYWLLILPFFTQQEEDPEGEWLDPDTWPGDWQRWRDKDTVLVSAATEQDARQFAAERFSDIWLDERYASCEPLSTSVHGVIMATGGQAENE